MVGGRSSSRSRRGRTGGIEYTQRRPAMWRGAARQFLSGNWSSPEGSGFGRRLECRPLQCLTRADGQRLVCRVQPWHVSTHAHTPHGPRSGRIQESGDHSIRIRQSNNTCLFVTLVDCDTVTFGFFVAKSVGRVIAVFRLNSALGDPLPGVLWVMEIWNTPKLIRGRNGTHPEIFFKTRRVFNHRLLNNFETSRIKIIQATL